MIEPITMYRCICDNCKTQWGDDVIAYADPVITWDAAQDSGWIEHEGKHYCGGCWTYDDNDNIVINQQEKKP